MQIYLRHPVNGTKVAIAEEEAKTDERSGWVRYDPNTPVTPDVAAPVEPPVIRTRKRRAIPEGAQDDYRR